MKIKNYSIIAFAIYAFNSEAQNWNTAGTNNGAGGNNNIGTANAFPVRHVTGGTLKFTTTVNNGLTNGGAAFNTPPQVGDGITINGGQVTQFPTATLDLFTSQQNQTFIRMDGTALMGTTASRFETTANLNGFWYNATGNGANLAPGPFRPQFIWNIQQNERGRLGQNGFWHYGNTPVDALNTVEIQSSALSPYGITGSGLRFTNLRSTATPLTNPGTGVLSVDTNGDVIYVPGGKTITGNNGINVTSTGIAQLGVDCNSSISVKVANRLTTDRMIHMAGNNLIFGDGGRIKMGGALTNCTVGNKLEITSGLGMPYFITAGGGTGSSGLRFTFLTSAKTPIVNGVNGVDNTKVLSVDANGDVVLVNASGGGDHDWYEVGTTTAPDNINDKIYTFNNA